ncbi:hypothetical protein ABW20_dc0109422 [Dactylellina cionopaga]|nr:hypothetical protein ABW20_dc0109422 [Dactylellina cionopaga]
MEDFRGKLLEMKSSGDTVLWDALDTAIEELNSHGKEFPKARKRIVCLSDGADTRSKTDSAAIQKKARGSKIVIDSFCIGNANHDDLMRTSRNTGGYKFKPKSLEEAMDLGEMEPVMSLSEREEKSCPLRMSWVARVQPDSTPRRKDHPNINDTFVRVDSIPNSTPRPPDQSPSASRPGLLRTARILSEIRNVVEQPHPFYDVFVSESNMGFWKIVMEGPPESAYGSGAFVLYISMEEEYPLFPPEGRFVTEILHPNVNKHGRICHSIFDRK